jgi:hypothetical protein
VLIVFITGMASDFGRWQSKDQPTATGIDRIEAEHILEKGAISLGIFAVNDYVCPIDHGDAPLSGFDSLPSLYQQQIRVAKDPFHFIQPWLRPGVAKAAITGNHLNGFSLRVALITWLKPTVNTKET